MKELLISIVIPVHNREGLIQETLDSVLVQTYPHWECIIVDDGSTDDSENEIKAYSDKDSRFKLFKRHRNPKGAPTCRNIGLEKTRGDFVVFMDSDDLLMPWCLEQRVQTIQDNPGYDFWVFLTGLFYHKLGDSSKRWNILHKNIKDVHRFILQDMPWHTMGPIWKVQAIKLLGGFDERALCWQDWELHLRALLTDRSYFKSKNTRPDSFYRMATSTDNVAISHNHKTKEHVLFRLGLIVDFYNRITAKYSDKQTLDALSVLFFRLIKDLKTNSLSGRIRFLLNFSKQHNLFNNIERILLSVYALNMGLSGLEKLKNRVIYKTLTIINPSVFRNKVSSTFRA